RLDAKLGGRDGNQIAFIRDRDIWVASLDGHEIQLTFSTKPAVSNGVAEYVMQEEFRRYTGYWWRPSPPNADGHRGNGSERILYMETDESNVEWVLIARPGINEEIDRYRYPRAGKPNASTVLKMVEFSLNSTSLPTQLALRPGFCIKDLFPWTEYLVRSGWLPDGR
ncbi:peptidase S9B, partial [Entophlyctis helioformis]